MKSKKNDWDIIDFELQKDTTVTNPEWIRIHNSYLFLIIFGKSNYIIKKEDR